MGKPLTELTAVTSWTFDLEIEFLMQGETSPMSRFVTDGEEDCEWGTEREELRPSDGIREDQIVTIRIAQICENEMSLAYKVTAAYKCRRLVCVRNAFIVKTTA